MGSLVGLRISGRSTPLPICIAGYEKIAGYLERVHQLWLFRKGLIQGNPYSPPLAPESIITLHRGLAGTESGPPAKVGVGRTVGFVQRAEGTPWRLGPGQHRSEHRGLRSRLSPGGLLAAKPRRSHTFRRADKGCFDGHPDPFHGKRFLDKGSRPELLHCPDLLRF